MTTQNVAPRWRPVFWLKWLAIAWFAMKMGGCFLAFPGPWGPKIGGKLPDGNEIYFQMRPRGGRESDDRLIWITPNGTSRHFWINRIHAGPGHVAVKYLDRGGRVWVEGVHEPWGKSPAVIASMDLATSVFRGEFNEHHPWAVTGAGTTLDAGGTWRIVWIIGPW